MKTKIACVQMKAESGKVKENINYMMSQVKKIMKEDPVDLIVFPELATTGYECGGNCKKLAESFPDGETIKKMSQVAKEERIHIIFGFIEEGKLNEKGNTYNSAAFIDDKGEPLGAYRKAHLVEGEETEYFTKGEEYKVYETSIGKIGIMICWDTAFPEVARILAIKGAEIIAVPAAWEVPNDGDWDIVHSARSFDNVVYVAACNHVGKDKSLTFFGKSKIVGPIGRTIVEAKGEPETIRATVDLDALPKLRDGYYALLKDRNPKTYEDILKKEI